MGVEACGDTIEDAIDAIDNCLEAAVMRKKLSPSAIAPSSTGLRAATKQVGRLVIAMSESTTSTSVQSGTSQSHESEVKSLTNSILVSMGPMSLNDQKVSQELDTNVRRVDDVVSDPASYNELCTLETRIFEEKSPAEKLKVYKEALRSNVKIAKLLKSGYVREPKGASSDEILRAVRACRGIRDGVESALRADLQGVLGQNASARPLAHAAMCGTLCGTGNEFNIEHIVDPSKQTPWLPACRMSKAEAKTEHGLCVKLMTAFSPLVLALVAAHPNDETIFVTLTTMISEMARGMHRSGAAVALEAVIAPTFRLYAEAWEMFDKVYASELPTMEAAWAITEASTSVLTFRAMAVMQPTTTTTRVTPTTTGTSEELRAANKAAKNLKKKNDKLQKKLDAALSADEDDKTAGDTKTVAAPAKRGGPGGRRGKPSAAEESEGEQ
jgi:hypothetical protein